MRAGAFINPHSKDGPLSRAAPCCTIAEGFRQSAELSRGYVGLIPSLALKPHRSGLIFNARDFRPVAKLYENHGSHVFAPIPSGKPVRPRLVIST